jgi:hypothetical protein
VWIKSSGLKAASAGAFTRALEDWFMESGLEDGESVRLKAKRNVVAAAEAKDMPGLRSGGEWQS